MGLVAHQLLTQTIATLLLRDAPSLLEQERCFIAGSGTSPSTSPDDVTRLPGTLHIHIQSSDRNSRCLRSGLLPHLSCRNSLTLLDCLTSSARVASQFDARPGLKFLVQKVASTTVAANLYRQASLARLIHAHALLEIARAQQNLTRDVIKRQLTSHMDSSKGGATDFLEVARHSSAPLVKHCSVFASLFKRALDDVCLAYVDLYVECDAPNAADELSKKILVFLVNSDDDDVTTVTGDDRDVRGAKVSINDASETNDVIGVTTSTLQEQGTSRISSTKAEYMYNFYKMNVRLQQGALIWKQHRLTSQMQAIIK